jgi:hypothetical protein
MNNYKKILNYFKKWEGAGMTGLGMLIVGFIFLWVGMSYFTYVLSIVLFIAGGVLFLYGNMGRATESDLKELIAHRKEKGKLPAIEEDRTFRSRISKKVEELEFEGYNFCDGLLYKRTKNSSLISSEYTYAHMKLLNDAFYVKKTVFSMLEDKMNEEILDIPFSTVTSITVERERKNYPVGKKFYPASTCLVVFNYGDGQQLRLPKRDDIYVDELVEKLNKLI